MSTAAQTILFCQGGYTEEWCGFAYVALYVHLVEILHESSLPRSAIGAGFWQKMNQKDPYWKHHCGKHLWPTGMLQVKCLRGFGLAGNLLDLPFGDLQEGLLLGPSCCRRADWRSMPSWSLSSPTILSIFLAASLCEIPCTVLLSPLSPSFHFQLLFLSSTGWSQTPVFQHTRF